MPGRPQNRYATMPLSTATITFDLADLTGTDFNASRTKVWLTTNAPDDTIVDTGGNKIRLGSGNVTVNTDGTGSVTVWVPSVDANPDTWQTYVHVDYPDRYEPKGRGKATFGPFTITTSGDLADLIEEQVAIPTATASDYADAAGSSASAAATSATSASTSATAAQTARTGAEAARDEAVDISGISTSDGVVEALVENPASLTALALTASIAAVSQPVVNIVAHGATPSAASAAIQAAHDSLPAGGGIIVIPEGDWECASTVTITKPVSIRGEGGANEFSNTRLRFAAATKGLDVDLPGSGDTFTLADVALLSYSVTATAGAHGCHMRKGRMVLSNVVAYQFGDHGWFFDSTTGGDNVNHSVGTLVRAYGCRGDGIRVEGGDSNAITLINPDVVANYGWGINDMSNHNVYIHPHADQQYNGSPGAYRDNGISNRWEWVYAEGGSDFLIDTGSSHGYLSSSLFGGIVVATSGIAHTTWEIVRKGGRNRVRVDNAEGDYRYVMGAGLIGADSFDIYDETRGGNVLSVNAAGTEMTHWASLFPSADNAQDFGWAGQRYRDLHLGRWIRLSDADGSGTLFLRNNGGVLEKSDDASSWSAV